MLVTVASDAIDVQRLMRVQHLRPLCMGCQVANADVDGAVAVLVTMHPDTNADDGQPVSWPALPMRLLENTVDVDDSVQDLDSVADYMPDLMLHFVFFGEKSNMKIQKY